MASVARFQYPSDNELSNASLSLGTGSTAVGFSLSNLFNGNPAMGWGASAETTFYLLQDYGGSTKAMKWMSFHNHNFDAGIVLTIQGNATNSWGAPTVNTSVTVPAARLDGRGQDFVWLSTSQSTALRWWRIGTTTTNSAAWRLGQLWCSVTASRTLPQNNYQPGITVEDVREGVSVETPTGVALRVADPSVRTRIAGVALGTRTEVEAVRDWRRKCSGFAQPTAFILEDDASTKEAFFVTHEADSGQIQHVQGGIWQSSVSLITQSPGLGWS